MPTPPSSDTPATCILASLAGEYRRYQALAEQAAAQLSEEDLFRAGPGGSNSVAIVMRHIGGNLKSRFTDFLTSDGEKPWRERDEEFSGILPSRDALMTLWCEGWTALHHTLSAVTDDDLGKPVVIRKQSLTVTEALHRSLAHISYHVGQIVYIARVWRGAEWRFLSVPPGKSNEYNQRPTREKPPPAL